MAIYSRQRAYQFYQLQELLGTLVSVHRYERSGYSLENKETRIHI